MYFTESYVSSVSDNSDGQIEVAEVQILDTSKHSTDLKARRTSLVRPLYNVNPITSKNTTIGCDIPKQPKNPDFKSLKSTIKSFNLKAVEDLEKNYSTCDKKHAQIAVTLAELYISGKRVPQNLPRAIQILSSSSLAESKLLLMTLAFNLGKYTEAYYYADLLSLAKCNCIPDATKVKQKTSDVIRRKGESKNFPKPLITGATK